MGRDRVARGMAGSRPGHAAARQGMGVILQRFNSAENRNSKRGTNSETIQKKDQMEFSLLTN